MNMISFAPEEVIGQRRLRFNDYRLHHIQKVLKSKPGDTLRVGQLGGMMGIAQIVELCSSACEVEFNLDTEPPAPAPIHLILALPRPKSLPRILFSAVNMGIKKISFINSWQVEKPFWSSDYLSNTSVEGACRKGLEQVMDTVMPKVEFHKLFKPFVEDILPAQSQFTSNWLAHPYSEPLDTKILNSQKVAQAQFTLVIGPEGGFIPYEITKFIDAGFKPFKFTNRIFKLETALPVIVSQFLNP